jgi:acetoin utilization protein AcuB
VNIEKWMNPKVVTVKPLDSIEHAREIMANHRINQLPVIAEGRLVGILTDRDVREAFPSVFEGPVGGKPSARVGGADPRKIPVELVMTPNVITLGPRNSVIEAARLMRTERVGAIPIVDGTRLVGILARSDVLDAFVELAEIEEASEGGRLTVQKSAARKTPARRTSRPTSATGKPRN